MRAVTSNEIANCQKNDQSHCKRLRNQAVSHILKGNSTHNLQNAAQMNASQMIDLKIENATLIEYKGTQSIAINNGLITEISPSITDSATTTLNASERLVIPGLIDPHLHLYKAFLLEQLPAQEGITNQPGTEAMLRDAMSLGGDVIGSAPTPIPTQNKTSPLSSTSHSNLTVT